MELTVVTSTPRPHDLLRLSNADLVLPEAPQWVRRALRATPWVVVRRAESVEGLIAVGVRGGRRADRYAMAVAAADVAETVAPENLAHRTSRDVQAMRALAGVRAALDRTALRWGPTGSVGFELATGVSTATEESDLDLLVRIPRLTPETLAQLAELDRLFADQPARIDCQVETDCGAFALTELIGGEPEILMRAATGPKLVSRAVAMS